VTFTKVAGRRYTISVARRTAPALATRYAPGYDDYLPHDAVHFLVEAEAGLRGAVFGRIASGGGFITPADPAESRRRARRKKTPPPQDRAEMALSERLVSICHSLWQLRSGHRGQLPPWLADTPLSERETPLVQRVCRRLDTFADCWHTLPVGGSITLPWPHPEGPRHPPRTRTAHPRRH
jgi:hypothetical protein